MKYSWFRLELNVVFLYVGVELMKDVLKIMQSADFAIYSVMSLLIQRCTQSYFGVKGTGFAVLAGQRYCKESLHKFRRSLPYADRNTYDKNSKNTIT